MCLMKVDHDDAIQQNYFYNTETYLKYFQKRVFSFANNKNAEKIKYQRGKCSIKLQIKEKNYFFFSKKRNIYLK